MLPHDRDVWGGRVSGLIRCGHDSIRTTFSSTALGVHNSLRALLILARNCIGDTGDRESSRLSTQRRMVAQEKSLLRHVHARRTIKKKRRVHNVLNGQPTNLLCVKRWYYLPGVQQVSQLYCHMLRLYISMVHNALRLIKRQHFLINLRV